MQQKAQTQSLMKQTIRNKKKKKKCQKLQIKVFKKLTYARMSKKIIQTQIAQKRKSDKNENLTRLKLIK